MPEATNNLLPPAVSPQAITLARWLARKAIKAQWQKAGVKVPYVDGREINIAAWEYLQEHLEELVGQAQTMLGEWSNSSTITNTPRSSNQPAKGKSNHDHDHPKRSKSNTTEEVA